MGISFRNFTSLTDFSNDYQKVRDFLIRINSKKLCTPYFLWGAWEWEVTHREFDISNQEKFGLWEDNGEIVAIAIYEMPLGDALLFADEEYGNLKSDLITYAKKSLHDNGKLRILLPNGDYEFQRAAVAQGFRPTANKWDSAALDIDMLQSYSLPDGFSLKDMTDSWDWQQYNRLMWCGFHPGEGRAAHDNETILSRKNMLSSPMINPKLVLAVVASDGNYVSHCGTWYQASDSYCYVEPVATDPEYRRMGLGKAVVLEAIRRCGNLGAKQAIVGSSQQFYYNIGFYPIFTATWWEQKHIASV
jgi:ribosomal protein S18 acetylase RimI-like enzyme